MKGKNRVEEIAVMTTLLKEQDSVSCDLSGVAVCL